MSVFKRILLFVGALIVLQLGITLVGSAVAGALVGVHVSDNSTIPKLAFEAGVTFAATYRPIIFAVSFVLAALLAFGRHMLTLVCAVPIAIIGFIGLQRISSLTPQSPLKSSPPPAPGASATPRRTRIGQHAILLKPVTITVAYGKATLPPGTMVTVLSENDGTAQVQAPDGAHFFVPVSQIR